MATRSNIKIVGAHGSNLWLYRHWDGYPACNGADICREIKKLRRTVYYRDQNLFSPLANKLLAKRYDATPHREATAMYEVTDQVHGDIEWLYVIRCKGSRLTVEVTEHNFRSGEVVHGVMTEKEFRSFCAKDLAEMRKRIQAHKRRNAA